MHKLEILLQSSEAKALAADLEKELSPVAKVDVRTLSTRGVELQAIISAVLDTLEAAGGIIAVAEALMRWRARAERTEALVSGVIKIDDRIELSLDKADRATVVRLLKSLG